MEYNDIAAKWWADHARRPLGLGDLKITDNQDPVGGIFMAMGFNALAGRERDSEEVIARFEKILARRIKEAAEKGNDVYVSTDYGPEYFLVMAMDEAGLRKTIFPMKTTMLVSKGVVKVKLGYGSEYKIIYPVESESNS